MSEEIMNAEVSEIKPERVMTIARGLARQKTIVKQLEGISKEIGIKGAWSNKSKHPYGDNKASVEKTHDQAQEKINSMYQQYNDLIAEFVKIKLAIDRTNAVTDITIGNRTMKVSEALMYKDMRNGIARHMQDFTNSYALAVRKAEIDVDNHNDRYASALENMDEKAKQTLIAQVSYLVPKERVEELNYFLTEFVSEIDGELNAINALTPLIWE